MVIAVESGDVQRNKPPVEEAAHCLFLVLPKADVARTLNNREHREIATVKADAREFCLFVSLIMRALS